MVLQRGQAVPIWGTAASGEAVSVTFNGQTKSAKADSKGKWRVLLDAMSAAGPLTLTAVGTNTVSFSDVMVGEVWHCAGQSNMDTRMNYSEYPNLADSIKSANYPLLRYITMRQPGQTIRWQQVNPTSVASMTATGYFFGRELLANLQGVAVGILNTSVGGTIIEQWLDPETVATIPALASDATAGGMYTAWVSTVAGYAVKGTVWLQGENNASSSALTPNYGERLEKLIPGWRKVWGQLEMPFIVAGLCHKGGIQTGANENSNEAKIREFQRLVTDTLPNTTLSVLVDLGADATWHYPQKPEAGHRLGRVALAKVYGKTGFTYESPVPKAVFSKDGKIAVVFDNKGSELKWSVNSAPFGFEVAGSNNVWSWSTGAELKGDTVYLTTNITNATQIRHAWANQPILKLWSKDGLPAIPFRMDIGSVPIVPDPEPEVIIATKVQIESNCGMAGILESTNQGFEGDGYVNFDNAIESGVGVILQWKALPQKPTWIRYANGGAADRSMNVKINGKNMDKSISFPATGSWTTWKMISVDIPWVAGRDSLVLEAAMADGGPNLDWIGFEDGNVSIGECELPVTISAPRALSIQRPKVEYLRLYDLQGARIGRNMP